MGKKQSSESWVVQIPHHLGGGTWSRLLWSLAERIRLSRCRGGVSQAGKTVLFRILRDLGEPGRIWDRYKGVEDFRYPGTGNVLCRIGFQPDLLHCHNLHGGYFDLRELPAFSHNISTVLTLHDAWLLSGHCAHSFDCERWKTGCGNCPDLTIYPAIRRDSTIYNWRRKKEIFSRSLLYVATPSRWLMDKVEQSILAPAIQEARVINNGVDLSTFHPPDQRTQLKENQGHAKMGSLILLSSYGITRNPWKDYSTVRQALARLGESWDKGPIQVIALGEEGSDKNWGKLTLHFESYKATPEEVAHFTKSAHLFVHPALVDTFPNVVLESLACGVPVVANAVGGIPEEIKGLDWEGHPREYPSYSPGEATGILVPPRNAESLAKALSLLLNDEDLRKRLGRNAAADARVRFDLEKQVDAYLDWFEEILSRDVRKARFVTKGVPGA